MKYFPLRSSYLLVLLLLLLPFGYLLYIYPSLPDRVPTHFGLNGKPNDWSRKSSLWLILAFMQLLALGLYLLFKYLPSIDPKRKAGQSRSTLLKIGIATQAFLSAGSVFVVYSASSGEAHAAELMRFLLPLTGLFLAYLGNSLYSIKPNYFLGIRTPWTLENEETWRATHHLGSKIFFAGGICIALVTLLTPPPIDMISMMVLLVLMGLIPVVYSLLYYRKHIRKGT